MPTTRTPGPALKRIAPGHYVLAEMPRYRIFRYAGRTWNARLRSHAYTQWVMLREMPDGAFEKDSSGHHREILESSTLDGLREKIARYFSPRVAIEAPNGTL
jgi:hypothetical protein